MSPLCHQTKTTTSKDRRKFLKILIGVERFELSTPCSQIRTLRPRKFNVYSVKPFPINKLGWSGLALFLFLISNFFQFFSPSMSPLCHQDTRAPSLATKTRNTLADSPKGVRHAIYSLRAFCQAPAG